MPCPSPLRRLGAPLLVALAAMSVSAATLAENYNTQGLEHHGDWQSLSVTLGAERHVRAVQRASYTDAMLSVNATPGACLRPWLELRSALGAQQPRSDVVNTVPVDVLIDDHRALSGRAVLTTERGDDGLYLRFDELDVAALQRQMATGTTLNLRIRMSDSVADYWFMAFSLDGAGEALERLSLLCASQTGDA